MATLAVGRSGAQVTLVEEQPWLGDRLAMESHQLNGHPASHWIADVEAELAAMPNVRISRQTTLTGAFDHKVLSALERMADHHPEPPPQRSREGHIHDNLHWPEPGANTQ